MTFLIVWVSALFLTGAAVYGLVPEYAAAKLEGRRQDGTGKEV